MPSRYLLFCLIYQGFKLLSCLSFLFSHLFVPNWFLSLICLYALNAKVLNCIIFKRPHAATADTPSTQCWWYHIWRDHTWGGMSSSRLPSIRHGHTGASPAKGPWDDSRTAGREIHGAAGIAGTVWPGVQEAPGRIFFTCTWRGGARSIEPVSDAQWQEQKQQAQTKPQEVPSELKNTFPPWEWPSTGTGCSGRLFGLHPQRYSDPNPWSYSNFCSRLSLIKKQELL